MLGLLNTVLSKGNTLLTYVKDGLVMANRFLTPPKLTFPVDASAEFNGTSDYIDTGIDINTTNSLTFGAWVYRENNSIARAIFGDGFPSANEAAFSLITIQGTNNLYISYGSTSVIVANLLPSLNQWFYLSITFDSGNIKAFVNGSELYNGSYNNAYPQHNRSSFLGARKNQSAPYNALQFFNGNLANVAIWNRALSSDEINSVMWKGYDALATTEKSGLQAWYKLEESELFDASNTSTTNLEEYAKLNSVTFEGKACLQTALNALPDITDARLYSAKYDIRVSGDGGTVEALNCVETELNALL